VVRLMRGAMSDEIHVSVFDAELDRWNRYKA